MNWDKEQIKDLILTDYLDGRMDAASREQLEAAIRRDADLQAFVRQAQQALEAPFAVRRKERPARVWSGIKQRIIAEMKEAPEAAWDQEKPGFWEWWVELRSATRLALSAASLALSVVLVAVVSQSILRPAPLAANRSEQVEYLMLLVQGDPLPEANAEEEGLGTTIENYFL